MVTENVDIRFRETGARVIKRKIDEIGVAANNATRGIFLMQRALFVLGGAGAIRALSRQVDMLTNMENRLRLTAKSSENLEAVQKRLFQVARDSRSSFESVADIYNRTALSVRELGISQAETLRFTESLAKATIISGASSREAHAALIQLGQGMASNTLRGDELRSVLEQLPFVADVIAKHLGVTRGELREFGKEGKISAETVLTAFRNAEEEIDELFAQTIPTISQALSVANINWLEFLDSLDDATSGSAKLARAIIVLSENLGLILGTLASVGIAIAATFAGKGISAVGRYIIGLRKAGQASTRLLEIENLRAASSIHLRGAKLAENAQRQAELGQRLALLGLQKAQLQQTVLDTQFTIVNGRARNITTGQFVGLTAAKTALTQATTRLSIVENVELTTAGRLAGARTAQTVATASAAAANTRLAAAQAASTTTTARLTGLFPIMAAGIGRVGVGLAGLAASIGLIGLIAIAVGAVIVAFNVWGNEIKVTADGVVGLKDFVVAAFQLMGEAIAPVATLLREQIGGAITAVTGFFAGFSDAVLEIMKFISNLIFDTFTFFPRIAVASIVGVIAAFKTLPEGAAAAATALANAFIAGFEAFANGAINAINKVIGALNVLLEFVGADKAAELFGFSSQIGKLGAVELTRFKSEYEGAGDTAAAAFGTAFTEYFDSTSLDSAVGAIGSALEPIGNAITERARTNIKDAAEAALAAQKLIDNEGDKPPPKPPGGGGKVKKDFAAILAGMTQEIELLKLSNAERKIQEGILKIEKDLKRGLIDTEKELAAATIKSLEAARMQAEVLDSIIGPREEIIEQMTALNELFKQGRIGLEDYTAAMTKMQVTANSLAGTLMGGVKAAIGDSIKSVSELGKAIGNGIVSAADSAADAIVDFVMTGKFNFKDFAASVIADLTKIIIKQQIMNMLGGLFGTGGFSTAATGPPLTAFASGGSILPTGPGSTDSQIVSFKKRPDERVDILTPGQQAAQRNSSRSNSEDQKSGDTNIVFNISSPDVSGFKKSQSQISASLMRSLSVSRRNQ